MEISAIPPSQATTLAIDTFDIIIFISTNAVLFSQEYFDINQCKPTCKIASIGKKTTLTLDLLGHTVDLAAETPFNSETFLALPALQDIEKQHILIVKGCGGRKTLENALTSRGGLVKTYDVYERKPASHSVKFINSICNDTQIDIIAITSVDSAKYYFDFFKKCSAFEDKPLLVGSQRIADALADMNIANPLVIAQNPSDDCMFETLLNWINDVERSF